MRCTVHHTCAAPFVPCLQEQYDPVAVMLTIRINRENTLAMARK